MKKQKYISKKWFILLAIILLLIPIAVYAEDPTITSQATGAFTDVLKDLVGILAKVLEVLQKILWPIFLAIGGLMGNDLLFSAGMARTFFMLYNITFASLNLLVRVLAPACWRQSRWKY